MNFSFPVYWALRPATTTGDMAPLGLIPSPHGGWHIRFFKDESKPNIPAMPTKCSGSARSSIQGPTGLGRECKGRLRTRSVRRNESHSISCRRMSRRVAWPDACVATADHRANHDARIRSSLDYLSTLKVRWCGRAAGFAIDPTIAKIASTPRGPVPHHLRAHGRSRRGGLDGGRRARRRDHGPLRAVHLSSDGQRSRNNREFRQAANGTIYIGRWDITEAALDWATRTEWNSRKRVGRHFGAC